MKLSVREMALEDRESIIDYFLNASDEFLIGMGAIPERLPSRASWLGIIQDEFHKPLQEKEFYYIIWLMNGTAIGHCNINKISYGSEAHMHLHMWKQVERKKGSGAELLKKSIPYFFANFKLEQLICEPYALNPAPNRTLTKLGFEFEKKYKTTPGWINFYQEVNRYSLSRDNFTKFYHT